MAENGRPLDSLRLNRLDSERLIFVLLLSLAAHLIAFGGYEYAKQLHLFPWLHRFVKQAQAIPQIQNQEQPLEFVTVDQPSTEAPQHAKYYSDKNSRAANPDANQNTDTPKINGKQTDAPMTESGLHPDFSKSQSSPPVQQQEQQLAMNEGDLTLGNPKNSQEPQPPRPRTLREAIAQNHLAGVQMRQDGGTHRQALVPSLDTIGTPFGAYDAAIVEAVTQRWYDLLDSQQFALDRTGRVTLRFHLNYDGTVTDMQVLDNTVGDLLSLVCRDSIEESAPFAAWPSDMRREVGANYREITFTFYYY